MNEPKGRILCANLNDDFCEVVEAVVASHEVVTVKSIDEAVVKASQQKFDLYVLNHELVDGSGIRLALLLKTLDPVCRIVFVTASRSITESQAQNVGALALIHLETDDFLTDFQTVVEDHLDIPAEPSV